MSFGFLNECWQKHSSFKEYCCYITYQDAKLLHLGTSPKTRSRAAFHHKSLHWWILLTCTSLKSTWWHKWNSWKHWSSVLVCDHPHFLAGSCKTILLADQLQIGWGSWQGSRSCMLATLLVYVKLDSDYPYASCSFTDGRFLHNNSFHGTIPSSVGNLTSLTYAAMQSNRLTGSLPAELGNLTKLLSLYAHGFSFAKLIV